MLPDAAIGAIVAAIIAAAISLLTLIIAKENKISEFRQEWVNELRNDIASAISSVSTINLLFGTEQQNGHKKEYVEAWTRTSETLARVELRLNLTETDHEGLQMLIREAEALIRNGEQGVYNQQAAETLQDRVVLQTQTILKREWNRVRDGEPIFQLAKSISAAIFVIVPIIAFVAFVLSQSCPDSCEAKSSRATQVTKSNAVNNLP